MAEPSVTGEADTPEAAEAHRAFAQGAPVNPQPPVEDDPSQPPKLANGELNPEYKGDPNVAGRQVDEASTETVIGAEPSKPAEPPKDAPENDPPPAEPSK